MILIYVLSVALFTLQWQSGLAMMKSLWPFTESIR